MHARRFRIIYMFGVCVRVCRDRSVLTTANTDIDAIDDHLFVCDTLVVIINMRHVCAMCAQTAPIVFDVATANTGMGSKRHREVFLLGSANRWTQIGKSHNLLNIYDLWFLNNECLCVCWMQECRVGVRW